jgi:hypothetical protein
VCLTVLPSIQIIVVFSVLSNLIVLLPYLQINHTFIGRTFMYIRDTVTTNTTKQEESPRRYTHVLTLG